MKQRILIVGAGFAGMWSALSAVRQLDRQGRDDVEVAVLAPQPELRIRPRFYEPDVQRMAAPLGELFAAVGVRFVQGSAQRIDVAGKRVEYRDAEGTLAQLDYDRLVLAAGSGVWRPASVAGIDAAFDVDQLEDALRLEAHLHALRDLPDSPARNTVVVAGGGFTGIETATEMPARLRAILGEKAALRVIVVDRGAAIGASMGADLSGLIAEASAELGVEWCLGRSVAAVDAEGVTLDDGQRIEAKTVVWTVGVRASTLTGQIPGERDAQGRLHVDRNLKVLGLDDVCATGDVARAATDDLGNHALMTCQ
ncbi:TPA: FAD-dependent oxidoreductase, partial [Pseudomonas aeruginosa]|nr:FAD-dependent oxidoreductase [Pseudomonas aeruginosa]